MQSSSRASRIARRVFTQRPDETHSPEAGGTLAVDHAMNASAFSCGDVAYFNINNADSDFDLRSNAEFDDDLSLDSFNSDESVDVECVPSSDDHDEE